MQYIGIPADRAESRVERTVGTVLVPGTSSHFYAFSERNKIQPAAILHLLWQSYEK